jgi:tripartite-type tricarboxylate transporter receptor subunit TctC
MSPDLGQIFIVDNQAGASGALGMGAVAKSAADGYTLGVGGVGPLVTLELLGRKLAYSPDKSLIPVAHMGALPLVIVAKPNLQVKTMSDLIALAKKDPGKLAFGTSGLGSPGHLAFEYLKGIVGIDMLHVPYKGDAPLTNDLIGGHLDIGVLTVAAAVAQAQGAKVKVLAVTSSKRSEQLPGVPTVAESGVPNYEAEIWNVLVAPMGTPAPVVQRINASLNAALGNPTVRQQLAAQGLIPVPMSVKAVGDFVVKEREKWSNVVKRSGAKLE